MSDLLTWRPTDQFDRAPGSLTDLNGWKYLLQCERPKGMAAFWTVLAWAPGMGIGEPLTALDADASWDGTKQAARRAAERHARSYQEFLGRIVGHKGIWAYEGNADPGAGILYHVLPQSPWHRSCCGLFLPRSTRYVEGEPVVAPMLCAPCQRVAGDRQLVVPGLARNASPA